MKIPDFWQNYSPRFIYTISCFFCLSLILGCAPASPVESGKEPTQKTEIEMVHNYEQLASVVVSYFGGPDRIICKVFGDGDAICMTAGSMVSEYKRLYGINIGLSAVETVVNAVNNAEEVRIRIDNFWQSMDRPDQALIFCTGGVSIVEMGDLSPKDPPDQAELDISDVEQKRLQDICDFGMEAGFTFATFGYGPLGSPGSDQYRQQVDNAIADMENYLDKCGEGPGSTLMLGTSDSDIIKKLAFHITVEKVVEGGMASSTVTAAGGTYVAYRALESFVNAVIYGIGADQTGPALTDLNNGIYDPPDDSTAKDEYDRHYQNFASACKGDSSSEGCKKFIEMCKENPSSFGCDGIEPDPPPEDPPPEDPPPEDPPPEDPPPEDPPSGDSLSNPGEPGMGWCENMREEWDFFKQMCEKANWETYECRSWAFGMGVCPPGEVINTTEELSCSRPLSEEEIQALRMKWKCEEEGKVADPVVVENRIIGYDCSLPNFTDSTIQQWLKTKYCRQMIDRDGTICGGYSDFTLLGPPPMPTNPFILEEIAPVIPDGSTQK